MLELSAAGSDSSARSTQVCPLGAGVAPAAAPVDTPSSSAVNNVDRVGRCAQTALDVYDGARKLGLTAAQNGHVAGTNAATLIAQETDPKTGAVDTQHLAATVADASRTDFGKASTAYADIRSALQQRNPNDAKGFDAALTQAVTRGVADTSAGAGTGLSAAGKSILIHNPILSVQWESTVSTYTGKGGFTPGLTDLLEKHGIEMPLRVNQPPAGSLTRAGGVAPAKANNINGALARDAIADRYWAAGHSVQTEVTRPNGGRRVDIAVDVEAADPRNNLRIEIESKVGRVSQSPPIAAQAAKDGAALGENAAVRGTGKALEAAGKVMVPVAVAADAVELGEAFHADGNRVGMQTGRAAAGVAGSWGGAIAGAEVGAALGSVVPGAGTVVGGVLGGVVGGVAGDSFGRTAFNAIASLL